ncbi:MAG: hypothetical protein LW817_00250, partial [Candidatus Caenarcaniphilales bacterium]|nr:hypothetical protein [Candidatus Caenarcaniphilales bacterium]
INYKLIYKILNLVGIIIAFILGIGIIYFITKRILAKRKIWIYTKQITNASSISEISLAIKEISNLKSTAISQELQTRINAFLEKTDKYNYGLADNLALEETRKAALELDKELKKL